MRLKVNMRLLAQAPNMSPEELKHATEFAAWQLEVGEGTANADCDGISITLPPRYNRYFLFLLLTVYQSSVCLTTTTTPS